MTAERAWAPCPAWCVSHPDVDDRLDEPTHQGVTRSVTLETYTVAVTPRAWYDRPDEVTHHITTHWAAVCPASGGTDECGKSGACGLLDVSTSTLQAITAVLLMGHDDVRSPDAASVPADGDEQRAPQLDWPATLARLVWATRPPGYEHVLADVPAEVIAKVGIVAYEESNS